MNARTWFYSQSFNGGTRDSSASDTEFLDALTYFSYRANRERSPEITPKAWETIFGNTEKFEEQYQAEQTHQELS